jgi:hypothetical protein
MPCGYRASFGRPNILKPELQSILTSATGLDPNELYRLQGACHASLSRMPVSG